MSKKLIYYIAMGICGCIFAELFRYITKNINIPYSLKGVLGIISIFGIYFIYKLIKK